MLRCATGDGERAGAQCDWFVCLFVGREGELGWEDQQIERRKELHFHPLAFPFT